jgi:hypothetical protein
MGGERTITLNIVEQFALVPALLERLYHLAQFPGMADEVDALESIRAKLLAARRSAIAEILAEETAAMQATSDALAPRIAVLEALL